MANLAITQEELDHLPNAYRIYAEYKIRKGEWSLVENEENPTFQFARNRGISCEP